MRAPPASPDLLFYDGQCGLCHGLVRFLARRRGTCRFAPLGGSTFRERVPAGSALPDSLVVLTGDRVLVRSRAVLHLLRALGGVWGLAARLGERVPARFADAVYDAVARRRSRWFARPQVSCPLVPPGLQARFLP